MDDKWEQAAFSAKAQNDKSNAMMVNQAIANLAEKVEKSVQETKTTIWLAVVFAGVSAAASVIALLR